MVREHVIHILVSMTTSFFLKWTLNLYYSAAVFQFMNTYSDQMQKVLDQYNICKNYTPNWNIFFKPTILFLNSMTKFGRVITTKL